MKFLSIQIALVFSFFMTNTISAQNIACLPDDGNPLTLYLLNSEVGCDLSVTGDAAITLLGTGSCCSGSCIILSPLRPQQPDVDTILPVR